MNASTLHSILCSASTRYLRIEVYNLMMDSAFVPDNEAQSQPILPSQRSPYFHTIHPEHPVLQDQSWLTPPHHPSHPLPPNFSVQPRLSRPPLAMASPVSSMSPLGPVPGPYQVHQQPHPYFAQGPSAMGYIPQQPRRYFGRQAPQEPIVPLRKEYSSLRELEQARPYSVPSHLTQLPQTINEHNAPLLPPRPISVAHTSSQSMMDAGYTNGGLISEKGEDSGPVRENLNDSDAGIPPRRLLPFPTTRRTGVQEATQTSHSEPIKEKSPSPKIASTDTQNESQPTVKSAISSRKTTTTRKKRQVTRPQANQPKAASKPVSSKRKRPAGRPESSPTHSTVSLKKPTKIKLLGRFANYHTNSPTTEGLGPPPSEVNESIPQESDPGQKSQEIETRAAKSKPSSKPVNTKRKATSKRPDDGSTHTSNVPKRPAKIGLLDRPSESHINCPSTEQNKASPSEVVQTPSEDPNPDQKFQSIPTELNCSSGDAHIDTNAMNPIERTPNDVTTVHRKPSSVNSEVAIRSTATKRSASQATTVSTISTGSSITTPMVPKSNEPAPSGAGAGSSPMSDETMILEQDISNIVNTRLQQGKADMIETIYSEVLIKMAVRDENIFEGVAKMLESSHQGGVDIPAI
ncbi:hypothetical protein F4861DRAFT_516326 [Xylaria intraflava]|nr:hypothetical protein F4861DRAFT_516326 [Xylaria intraflava]